MCRLPLAENMDTVRSEHLDAGSRSTHGIVRATGLTRGRARRLTRERTKGLIRKQAKGQSPGDHDVF